MHKYVVIGISDSEQFTLPADVSVYRYFSGGKRHHERVKPYLPAEYEWMDITGNIPALVEQYKLLDAPVVIFASGDPLFYGFANSLMRYDEGAEMKVYPYFNSLQLLCQKSNVGYAGMCNTSVHGRGWDELDTAVITRAPLIGVLTDQEKTPAAIAARLLAYGYDNYEMIVGEALEGVDERIVSVSLSEAVGMTFNVLNCVLLVQSAMRHKYFGIPDHLFEGLPNRPNMITKMPIRMLSLTQLDLHGRSVLWDIGFCTGSVSVEAKNNFPSLKVVAFEKRDECAALLDINAAAFGVPGITKVMGDVFEQDLDTYPLPDAVFIGGHGNRMNDLMQLLHPYIKTGGRVVMNAVKSKEEFMEAVEVLGYKLHPPVAITIDNHNPITVLTAEKI